MRIAGALLAGALLVLGGCSSSAEPVPAVPEGTEIGMRAPALTGTLTSGEPFALPEEGEGVATLVVFYRGASCGLCRTQLVQLQAYLPAYRRQGARVVGVTLDDPELSAALAAQTGLEFDLVSVDSAVFLEWGVLTPDHAGPLPATFIVGGDGIVRYRHIGRNAADRPSDPELLTIVSGL